MDELKRDLPHSEVPYEHALKLRSYLQGFLKDRMTRRELIKYGGLASLSLSSLWALACQVAKAPAAPTPMPEIKAPEAGQKVKAATYFSAKQKVPVPERVKKGEIVQYQSADPATFDGAFNQPGTLEPGRQTWSTLLRFEADGFGLEGDLATEWSRSPDGLIYTFKLRKDAKWQKGYGPLNAKDVAYTVERMQKETKARWHEQYKMIKTVETPDDYTAKIIMNKPFSPFLYYMTDEFGMIYPKAAVEKFGKEFGLSPDTYVGSGAYILKEWRSREYILYEANPEYYGGKAKIAVVRRRWFGETAAAAMALEAGDMDSMSMWDYDSAAQMLKNPKMSTYVFNVSGAMNLFFNMRRKPFDDVRVRQALAHAINKKEIVAQLQNMVEPANSIDGPNDWGYADRTICPEFPFDPKKAKELLSAAGIKELEIDHKSPGTLPIYVTAAIVMAKQWSQIGVQTKLTVVPTWPAYQKLAETGELDVFMWELGYRPPHTYTRMYDRWHSKSFPAGKDPTLGRYDELLDKTATEGDEKKALEYARQVQVKAQVEDTFSVPLWWMTQVQSYPPYLRGVHHSGTNHGITYHWLSIEE